MLDDEKRLLVEQLALKDKELARKFAVIDKHAMVALEMFFCRLQSWQSREGLLDWLEDYLKDTLYDHDAAFPYAALFYFIYQIEEEEWQSFKEVYEAVRVASPWN